MECSKCPPLRAILSPRRRQAHSIATPALFDFYSLNGRAMFAPKNSPPALSLCLLPSLCHYGHAAGAPSALSRPAEHDDPSHILTTPTHWPYHSPYYLQNRQPTPRPRAARPHLAPPTPQPKHGTQKHPQLHPFPLRPPPRDSDRWSSTTMAARTRRSDRSAVAPAFPAKYRPPPSFRAPFRVPDACTTLPLHCCPPLPGICPRANDPRPPRHFSPPPRKPLSFLSRPSAEKGPEILAKGDRLVLHESPEVADGSPGGHYFCARVFL